MLCLGLSVAAWSACQPAYNMGDGYYGGCYAGECVNTTQPMPPGKCLNFNAGGCYVGNASYQIWTYSNAGASCSHDYDCIPTQNPPPNGSEPVAYTNGGSCSMGG
jgi:hypothetical protein